jgi:hypothetical protein
MCHNGNECPNAQSGWISEMIKEKMPFMEKEKCELSFRLTDKLPFNIFAIDDTAAICGRFEFKGNSNNNLWLMIKSR